MKKLIITAIVSFMLLGVNITFAQDTQTLDLGQQFKIKWTLNTEPDLAGYRIYMSMSSGQYTFGAGNEYASVGVVATSGPHAINMIGTYFFVVTAFDAGGFESGPSNEVSAVVEDLPPKPPGGCAILKF